tara:strand:- start:35952 stop:36056 length:105 start_codon:yes stop_codon:yes gene_type:complete
MTNEELKQVILDKFEEVENIIQNVCEEYELMYGV